MDKGLNTSFYILGDWLSASLMMVARWMVTAVILPVRFVAGIFTPIDNVDELDIFPL